MALPASAKGLPPCKRDQVCMVGLHDTCWTLPYRVSNWRRLPLGDFAYGDDGNPMLNGVPLRAFCKLPVNLDKLDLR